MGVFAAYSQGGAGEPYFHHLSGDHGVCGALRAGSDSFTDAGLKPDALRGCVLPDEASYDREIRFSGALHCQEDGDG